MKDIDVLVVGSVNMDLNAQVRELPERGATILGRTFTTAAGGKGANQAVASARLGAKTAMICAVGRDEYGSVLLEGLETEGIDLSGAQRVEGPSGVALITIEASGQNTIVAISGANSHVTPAVIGANVHLFQRAKTVLLQFEIPVESVVPAARLGRDAGCTVILNPAPAADVPDELIPLVDIVTPNETEAEGITGVAGEEAAARALLDRGVKTVIVTRGAEGVLVATESRITTFPTFEVDAVDATAAGDAFNGALAARLAAGDDVDAALPWALATGALTVTKLGAQPSLPGKEEVAKLVASR